jgi:hypothetical protein
MSGTTAKLNPMNYIASTKLVGDEKEFFSAVRRKSRDALSPISRRSAVVEKRANSSLSTAPTRG